MGLALFDLRHALPTISAKGVRTGRLVLFANFRDPASTVLDPRVLHHFRIGFVGAGSPTLALVVAGIIVGGTARRHIDTHGVFAKALGFRIGTNFVGKGAVVAGVAQTSTLVARFDRCDTLDVALIVAGGGGGEIRTAQVTRLVVVDGLSEGLPHEDCAKHAGANGKFTIGLEFHCCLGRLS